MARVRRVESRVQESDVMNDEKEKELQVAQDKCKLAAEKTTMKQETRRGRE